MKYGIEINNGHRLVYQFASENERAAWIASGDRRSVINGNSREVKRALYHGEVLETGCEREREIWNA